MHFKCVLFILLIERVVNAIVPHPSVSRLELPLAPYNVKIFCRSGIASNNSTSVPVLCPSASTTCGYLSIPSMNKNNEETVIFECMDSSVVMSEDFEGSKDIYYSYLCSHESRCHKMPLSRLNIQFLDYLKQTYNVSPEDLFDSKKPSKFCCSNDHKELLQLLGSNLSIIPTNSTPVKCGDNKCLSGAVGCMSHAKEKFSDPVQILHNHDYISPVEIIWEDSNDLVEDSPSTSRSVEDDNHLNCVYPHFNDEIYRYCLMIKAQQTDSQCWSTRGHKICCCLVERGEETCTPVNSTVVPSTTTTETPKIRSNVRRKNTRLMVRKKKCPKGLTVDCGEHQTSSCNSMTSRHYLFFLIILLIGRALC